MKDKSIRIDEDVWAKIRRQAKKEGCWKKTIIRRATDLYLRVEEQNG